MNNHDKIKKLKICFFQTEVEVYRKDSRKLPIGDPDIDWEETVYLNLIIHQFEYTLTLAVCTRTSPKELQVLRRHSQVSCMGTIPIILIIFRSSLDMLENLVVSIEICLANLSMSK